VGKAKWKDIMRELAAWEDPTDNRKGHALLGANPILYPQTLAEGRKYFL